MKNKLNIKDILLLALLTAIYFMIYMIGMMIITPLGAFGHSISPGIAGLLGGTIIYFISRKIGKYGQFTILNLILMAVFALMGGGYLPWLITSTLCAIIADIIGSGGKDVSVHRVAIASGLIGVGSILGAIVPATFFAASFKEEWIKRGQTLEQMEATIKYGSGIYAILSIIIVFLLCVMGVYIGKLILKKHLKES